MQITMDNHGRNSTSKFPNCSKYWNTEDFIVNQLETVQNTLFGTNVLNSNVAEQGNNSLSRGIFQSPVSDRVTWLVLSNPWRCQNTLTSLSLGALDHNTWSYVFRYCRFNKKNGVCKHDEHEHLVFDCRRKKHLVRIPRFCIQIQSRVPLLLIGNTKVFHIFMVAIIRFLSQIQKN